MHCSSSKAWAEYQQLFLITLSVRRIRLPRRTSNIRENHLLIQLVKSGTQRIGRLYLRALKSPQKFRTPGCSSANFLGSWHISGLKSKSYYEIWTFWSIKVIQMIQFHRFLLQKLSSSSGYSFYGFWLGCGFSFPYYFDSTAPENSESNLWPSMIFSWPLAYYHYVIYNKVQKRWKQQRWAILIK